LAIAVLALALVAAAPARAEVTHWVPNFPTLLPPIEPPPTGTLNPGFDVCPSGDSSCPDDVIAEMYRRWEPLDRSCDHRAVFALTYLRTTEEFQRTITADPAFFEDGPWVNHEDAVFADFYFRAYDSWASGNAGAVPGAWQIAFSAAASPNVTGAGDLLLGMNAHINRDLPYTLAAVGLAKQDGSSRKTDHDHVNAFLENIADPLQIELAERYDQIFAITDAEPSPFDEEGVLAAVRLFRENAWRYAEQLLAAQTDAQRQLVSQAIENQASAYALLIVAANTVPGYTGFRDAQCAAYQAAHPPSAADGAAAGDLGARSPDTALGSSSVKLKTNCKRRGHRGHSGHRRHCGRNASRR
jgi:hypothetical protein